MNRLYPGQTARCHSAMAPDARKPALERFRDGEVRILISCRALNEGFDVPSASIGIVMSSTSVNRQRIQRLGRHAEIQPAKPDTSLLSEASDCFYRGIIRPDWLMGKAYCSEKPDTAKTISERNYWICMKQIAREK